MPGGKTMKLSTVSSVYNEEKHIEKAIESLAKQDILPDETIIVNDGSTDKTKEILNRLKKKYKWVKVIHSEKNIGRHIWFEGYKAAKGPIITIFDIDTIPPKGWIKEIKESFTENIGLVGGAYIPKKSKKIVPKLQEIMTKLMILLKEKKVYRFYQKNISKQLHMAGTNTSFRKDFAEELKILEKRRKYANDRRIQLGFMKSKYDVKLLKSIVYSRVPGSFYKFTLRWFRWGKAEPARIGLKMHKIMIKLLTLISPLLVASSFLWPVLGMTVVSVILAALILFSIYSYFLLKREYNIFFVFLSLFITIYAKMIHSAGYLHYCVTRK